MRYTKIILCGKRCTGKTTLLWNLQSALNWPLFSVSEYLRDLIRMYHLSPGDIEKKRIAVSRDIDTRMLALLRSDHCCIIDARVFGYVDQEFPHAVKVLLHANDTVRIERSSKREQSSLEKAENRLLKKEEEWLKSMRDIYGHQDFFNPKYYDLVIDTTSANTQEVLRKVLMYLA